MFARNFSRGLASWSTTVKKGKGCQFVTSKDRVKTGILSQLNGICLRILLGMIVYKKQKQCYRNVRDGILAPANMVSGEKGLGAKVEGMTL